MSPIPAPSSRSQLSCARSSASAGLPQEARRKAQSGRTVAAWKARKPSLSAQAAPAARARAASASEEASAWATIMSPLRRGAALCCTAHEAPARREHPGGHRRGEEAEADRERHAAEEDEAVLAVAAERLAVAHQQEGGAH